MSDITEKPYARFLEDSLRKIDEFNPEKIAIAAIHDGTIITAYYRCSPVDLATISGNIDQDAVMYRLEDCAEWLRGLLEDEEPESDEDD